MNYLNDIQETPSDIILPGEVLNRSGGAAFPVDCWTRFQRFLILGNEGGTYYARQQELTVDALASIDECVATDPLRAVGLVREISLEGRAPKQDPALFALAILASSSEPKARKAALKAMPDICRTGSTFLQWVGMVDKLRGWGAGLVNACADWYTRKEDQALAYQILKYRQRAGWSHRDVLRKCHPEAKTSVQNAIFNFIAQDKIHESLPGMIHAYHDVWKDSDDKHPPHIGHTNLIGDYRLSMDMLPNGWQTSPKAWEAIFPHQPLGNLIRNLATMTRVGLLDPMSPLVPQVIHRITSSIGLAKARIHPFQALIAGLTYGEGKSIRGSATWEPTQAIVHALNDMFYLSFKNVKPINKRIVIAVDMSASMTWDTLGTPGLTSCIAAASLAMQIARTESQYIILGFNQGISVLDINPSMSLAQVARTIQGGGGTDCSLPMVWADANKIQADAFIILTDNETNYGAVHPHQAVQGYRQRINPDMKLAVVAMTADKFSIADPNDSGMLDIVGFDANLPSILREFIITP